MKEPEGYDAALCGVDTTPLKEHACPVFVILQHGELRKDETEL
jgi:hypothetical protein